MTDELAQDTRRAPRRTLRVRAVLRDLLQNLRYDVRTENVSADGVAVRMPHALKAGTKVQIAFGLASSIGPKEIKLDATVIHTMLSGDSWLTGVAISNISSEHRALLAAYCTDRH